MIRFLWDKIVSQPVSLWFSLIATAVSIASFCLSQRNNKRAQGLVALEKRTKILYEVIDAQSKLIAVENAISQANAEMRLLRSNSRFQESKMDVSSLDSDYLSIRQMASGLARTLDVLKAKLKEVNEETRPSFIESLMPEIRYLQNGIDQLSLSLESGLITLKSMREIFEEADRELQTIEKRTETLTEYENKLQEEIARARLTLTLGRAAATKPLK